MTYKIGQILTSNQDVEIEEFWSGEKNVIPKGNKIIIGADKLAHHLRDNMIQPFAKEINIEGYDAEGLGDYLGSILYKRFPNREILEMYSIDECEFQDIIHYALRDIGF